MVDFQDFRSHFSGVGGKSFNFHFSGMLKNDNKEIFSADGSDDKFVSSAFIHCGYAVFT